MNYQTHYNNLIETRRHRILKEDEYYEKHHIIMKSMGGTDHSSNLIFLTAKEHFIAHLLLWKIHRNKQTAYAFHLMSNRNGKKYKEAREAASFANSIEKKGKPFANNSETYIKSKIGLKKSETHKKNIGDANRGRILPPMTDETKLNIAKALSGKPKSLEAIENMKVSAKKAQAGRTYSAEEKEKRSLNIKMYKCEHCSKEIKGHLNFKKWHGDNCKYKI